MKHCALSPESTILQALKTRLENDYFRSNQDAKIIHMNPLQFFKRLSLELVLDKSFAVGSAVDWVIHPAHMVMHRRDRASHGERENPVHGVVKEFLELGETSFVSLKLKDHDAAYLSFSVSSHSARRNKLGVGAEASVSLLAEGIHLMPQGDGKHARHID